MWYACGKGRFCRLRELNSIGCADPVFEGTGPFSGLSAAHPVTPGRARRDRMRQPGRQQSTSHRGGAGRHDKWAERGRVGASSSSKMNTEGCNRECTRMYANEGGAKALVLRSLGEAGFPRTLWRADYRFCFARGDGLCYSIHGWWKRISAARSLLARNNYAASATRTTIRQHTRKNG